MKKHEKRCPNNRMQSWMKLKDEEVDLFRKPKEEPIETLEFPKKFKVNYNMVMAGVNSKLKEKQQEQLDLHEQQLEYDVVKNMGLMAHFAKTTVPGGEISGIRKVEIKLRNKVRVASHSYVVGYESRALSDKMKKEVAVLMVEAFQGSIKNSLALLNCAKYSIQVLLDNEKRRVLGFGLHSHERIMHHDVYEVNLLCVSSSLRSGGGERKSWSQF